MAPPWLRLLPLARGEGPRIRVTMPDDPGYPPPDYGPPAYAPRRRRRGRWMPDDEDLEAYLADLEDEIAAVCRDLEARRSQPRET